MSYENPRIQLEMPLMDIIKVMSEGNPGALRVVMELLTDGGKIDTQDVFEGFGSVMGLDNLDLYGPKIWMLYKDVCGENLSLMIVVLRAVQLGHVSDADVKHAVDNYGEGLDLPEIKKYVLERLDGFQYKEAV